MGDTDSVWTLADDLALLLITPRTERIDGDWHRPIAGAVLMHLVLGGRVAVTGSVRWAKVVAVDAGPTGDVLLDRALRRLDSKPVRAARAVRRLSTYSYDVFERLVAAGVVEKEEHRRMGIPLSISWRVARPELRNALVATLTAVLREGAEPDERTACLVEMLTAATRAQTIVGGTKKEIRARVTEILRSERAESSVRAANHHARRALGDAVSRVIQSDQA